MARVLILDDEARYGALLGRFLKRTGWDVRATTTTAEASSLLREFQPQVIVVDRMLREMRDGLSFIEEIRQEGGTMDVIMITGFPTQEHRARLESLGVRVLRKPFRPEDLLEMMRNRSCPTTEES